MIRRRRGGPGEATTRGRVIPVPEAARRNGAGG